VGEKPEIVGVTRNFTLLERLPPAVTTCTIPVVAPAGTVAVIAVIAAVNGCPCLTALARPGNGTFPGVSAEPAMQRTNPSLNARVSPSFSRFLRRLGTLNLGGAALKEKRRPTSRSPSVFNAVRLEVEHHACRKPHVVVIRAAIGMQ
jgi:hypothetical protein